MLKKRHGKRVTYDKGRKKYHAHQLTPFLHVAIESITDEELISLAREAVSAALAGVNEMRRREGENLAADLNKRIDLLREKLLYLKSKQNIIVEDYEKRLRSRMIKLLEDSGPVITLYFLSLSLCAFK